MSRYKRLGKNLKKLRKQKELTQERLAELANLDPKTIVDIEGEKRANPTLETLNKLARALKVKLEDLLFS
jgi:transcriptional regulator with XRE-family HTH domain